MAPWTLAVSWAPSSLADRLCADVTARYNRLGVRECQARSAYMLDEGGGPLSLVSRAPTAIAVPTGTFRWQGAAAAIQSLRPADTAVVVLGTLIAARLAQPIGFSLADIALVALANGFLCAASMAFNDWCDVREDGINQPMRPIVAGRISRPAVLQIASVLFLVGVLVAWATPGWRFGAVAIAIVGASVAYSLRLKSIPLVGNATIAVVHSCPFWCWLLWDVAPMSLYVPLCLVVVADRFGTEVIKTSQDWRGDRLSDMDTVATRWGALPALILGCASLALAALVAWWPVAAGDAGRAYLIWTLAVTSLILLTCLQTVRALPVEVIAGQVVRLHRVVVVVAVTGLLLV